MLDEELFYTKIFQNPGQREPRIKENKVFSGIFLGLYFPKIEYQNIANRSSLVKKAIISTSKFTSIKLNDHIYSYKFVTDKESSNEISKFKYNKKKFKSQIIKEDKKKIREN